MHVPIQMHGFVLNQISAGCCCDACAPAVATLLPAGTSHPVNTLQTGKAHCWVLAALGECTGASTVGCQSPLRSSCAQPQSCQRWVCRQIQTHLKSLGCVDVNALCAPASAPALVGQSLATSCPRTLGLDHYYCHHCHRIICCHHIYCQQYCHCHCHRSICCHHIYCQWYCHGIHSHHYSHHSNYCHRHHGCCHATLTAAGCRCCVRLRSCSVCHTHMWSRPCSAACLDPREQDCWAAALQYTAHQPLLPVLTSRARARRDGALHVVGGLCQ